MDNYFGGLQIIDCKLCFDQTDVQAFVFVTQNV